MVYYYNNKRNGRFGIETAGYAVRFDAYLKKVDPAILYGCRFPERLDG